MVESQTFLNKAQQDQADKIQTEAAQVQPLSGANIQGIDKVVVPISELRPGLTKLGPGLKNTAGTGFCLDPDCRFIVTNYHVATLAKDSLKIEGEHVFQRHLATGPDDEGATMNSSADGSVPPMKYTLGRDLAVFELRHPLSPKHFHGLALSRDDLRVGQEVDIYSYPYGAINLVRHRQLERFHGKFLGEAENDILTFGYDSSDKKVTPGESGGIVVDSKTGKIVGVLNGIALNADSVVTAVSIQALADFLKKAQPCLHAQLFPDDVDISPTSPDLYPEYVPIHSDNPEHRRLEEPIPVKQLRQKAQAMANSMLNFIAVQSFSWGRDNHSPVASARYEVQVVDGYQRFREYPDGKKRFHDVPLPPTDPVMAPSDEWSRLPGMVGTNLNLKIHQAADVMVDGRKVLVFQYHSDAEDKLCGTRITKDFGFFIYNKDVYPPCYGEVWTDEDLNILRMSENIHLLPGGWNDFHAVVTYDWLNKPGEAPMRVPATIASQMEFKKKIYWCKGLFTDYREFGVKVKIGPAK